MRPVCATEGRPSPLDKRLQGERLPRMGEQMQREGHQRPRGAQGVPGDDVAVHHVPQQLAQQRGALLRPDAQRGGEATPHQVILQRGGTRLLAGELQVFLERERIDLVREVASGELRSHLPAQEAGVGSGEANAASGVQQRAHQPLPFRHFLHFVEIHRRLRMAGVQDREHRGEVVRPQAIEPGVFEIDGDRTALDAAPDLSLQGALAAAPDAREHQRVGCGGGFPCGLKVPRHFIVGSLHPARRGAARIAMFPAATCG